MLSFWKTRLRGVDKKIVTSGDLIDDYNSAEKVGRISFGRLALYYRDLGKKYYVPYDYITRAFIRISVVEPDDSPAIEYFRIILMHDEKEFANLIFNKRPEADKVIEKLPQMNPDIAIGYVAPKDGKVKARFK